jgi:outer membrane protein assembly factor BamB
MGFLMKLIKKILNIRNALMLILMTLLIIVACSGLARLKINNDQLSEEKKDGWLTIYQSNSRWNTVNTDIEPPYNIIWKKGYKSVINDQPLALADYLVFTSRNGNLGLVDVIREGIMGDGHIAPGFEHAPVIDSIYLYYGANLGEETLASMNLLDLKKRWEVKLPHIYTAPLIWNKYIYAGTKEGVLFCLEKDTGKKVWHFTAQGPLLGIPAERSGRIYFTDINANLYCLDGKTGKSIWKTALQPNSYNGPVITDERIFIGSTAGIFYALTSDSGKIIWQTYTGGSIYSNAAYRDGIVYLGNNAHDVIALQSGNGKILWKFTTEGIINTTPLVGVDYLYVASWDKNLYIISRYTGEEIAKIGFNKALKSSPLIYKNRLYVHTANDDIICVGNTMN